MKQPNVLTSRLHFWILGALLLYQLLLFSFFSASAWGRRSADRPQTMSGEGVLIYGDGCGYYAWLRSLLIDGDWNFENEFDEHNPLHQSLPGDTTAIGRRANHYPVGPALVWAPATLVTHAMCVSMPSQWPADGYSLPYQLAVGLTTLGAAVATLFFLFGICCFYAERTMAALAVCFVVLGTTLLNYQAIEVSMAHGLGAAATALLVWYWLGTYGSQSSARWLGVGALVGLAGLMRYQLALLALLPVGESVFTARRRGSGSIFGQVGRLALAGGAATLVFVPQMIAWKAIYGHYLLSPLVLAHSWLHPDFERILLSTDRGYFYWTPINIMLVAGMIAALLPRNKSLAGAACSKAIVVAFELAAPARDLPFEPAAPASDIAEFEIRQRETLTCLLLAFAAQVYLLASVTGDGVFLGTSFGYRHLTEATILLAPGLALLLQSGTPARQSVLLALCGMLCIWNVLLMAQYHREILPRQAGAELQALFESCLTLDRTWPQGMLLFLAGPALVCTVLLLRRWPSEEMEAVDATPRPFDFLRKRKQANPRRQARIKKKSLAKT